MPSRKSSKNRRAACPQDSFYGFSGVLLLVRRERPYSSNNLLKVESTVPWGRPRSSLAWTRQGKLPALAPAAHACPPPEDRLLRRCSPHRVPPALATVQKGTSKPGDSPSQVSPLSRVSDGEPAPGPVGTEAGEQRWKPLGGQGDPRSGGLVCVSSCPWVEEEERLAQLIF